MMFNSLDFAVFFAITFAVFFLLPQRWKNAFLLAASYFFYGYWSVRYLCLLFFTMWLDYFIAIRIDESRTESRRRHYLVASLVANLGILFAFKYYGLFSELLASLTHHGLPKLDVILPFGISFYTFHAMSYTIDVYRRAIPAERNFTHYSGYVMFFPQLVAGPIARASHLLHQFKAPKYLRTQNLIDGSYLVLKGFLMKIVLADSFGGFADAYFGPHTNKSPMLVAQAVYFFAFQIYCDFSGYTLIARGIAKWMDFDLVENFRTPYFASSITDFWRRWHISLSTWLRDYLYISLGGNRNGRWKTYRNLMVTMLLGGLWHGASLTFVAWGGLHGLYLAVEKALEPTRLPGLWRRWIPAPLRCLFVFHLVCLAWVFFRANTFGEAYTFLRYCAELVLQPATAFRPAELHGKLWTMAGFFLAFEWLELKLDLERRYRTAPSTLRFAAVYAAIVFIALNATLNPLSFVYFQF